MSKKRAIMQAMEPVSAQGNEGVNLEGEVSTQVETDNGLANAGQVLIDNTLGLANTPEEAQQVIATGQTLDQAANEEANVVREEKRMSGALVNALGTIPKVISSYGAQYTVPQLDQVNYYNELRGKTPEEKRLMELEYLKKKAVAKENAAAPAIEALGVQQYFPSIGNDNINVGTYSGKKIGNVSIFVPKGGQLPFGLRDAQRRAREAEMKAQAAKQEKIAEYTAMAPAQYLDAYKSALLEDMDLILESINYDRSEIENPTTELGRIGKKTLANYETGGKELMYIDAMAQQVVADLKAGRFVPEQGIALLDKWNKGQIDIRDMITREGAIPELASEFKSYLNISKRTDELAPIIRENGMTIEPLNPNKLMDPKHLEKANQAFVVKPGQSYDNWYSGMSTYYDMTKFDKLVKAEWESGDFYKGKNATEEQQRLAEFAGLMAAKIGSKVEVKHETVANDNIEMKRLNWEMAVEKRNRTTFYKDLNEKIQDQDFKSGLNNIFNNPNLSAEQKKQQYWSLLNSIGDNGTPVKIHGYIDAMAVPISSQEKNNPQRVSKDDAKITVKLKDGSGSIEQTADYIMIHKDKFNLSKSEETQIKRVVEEGYIDMFPSRKMIYPTQEVNGSNVPISYKTKGVNTNTIKAKERLEGRAFFTEKRIVDGKNEANYEEVGGKWSYDVDISTLGGQTIRNVNTGSDATGSANMQQGNTGSSF